MSDESNTEDSEAEQALLARPTTMPDPCPVCVKGFPEEQGKRLGNLIVSAVNLFGRVLDLERLDGITVAADYPAALRELDRGFAQMQPLTPTTENAIGIAMTPPVLRDGVIKSHIVFNVGVVLQLDENGPDEERQVAFYIVGHECAHVQLLKALDQCFPGHFLKHRYKDFEESFLWETSNACWDEYAACRLSAPFGERQLGWYEDTFLTALQNARERGNAAIRTFRLHKDVRRLTAEIVPVYSQVLTFASYVLGHLAGIGADLSAVPRAQAALRGHWFEPHFTALAAALEKIWSRYGDWAGLEEFTTIGAIAKDVLRERGVDIQRRPSGEIYLNVPFTPETMPV